MKRTGVGLLVAIALGTLLAPWLAPNAPDRRFSDLLYAPPTPVRVYEDGVHAPFIHPWRLVSRRGREFAPETRRLTLRWFADGRLIAADPDSGAPLLLLGADSYGRDVFARVLHGARTTLALAVVATCAATLLGLLVGGAAGYARGWLDVVLSRGAEFVLVLPAIYVALAIRSVMPLVLEPRTVFLTLTGIFAFLGSPIVARGVRAIVLAEREQEYALAARATGCGDLRLLVRHLLPATWGYIAVQATLLFPAFILAEATISYIGLGFSSDTTTWGTMLREAANVSLLVDMPWALAPAAAIFLSVLGVNLAVQGTGRAPVQLEDIGGPGKQGLPYVRSATGRS
jgi:peptide/nickel transport system permease protein